VNLQPTKTTVSQLRRLRAPRSLGPARVKGVETTTYRVDVRLVKMKLEENGDVLLVVLDPDTHEKMTVRYPAIGCIGQASAQHRKLMREARVALATACGEPDRGSYTRVGGSATITGVGFFAPGDDEPDAAPNGIQLHPVLGFRTAECLVGAG